MVIKSSSTNYTVLFGGLGCSSCSIELSFLLHLTLHIIHCIFPYLPTFAKLFPLKGVMIEEEWANEKEEEEKLPCIAKSIRD